MRSEAPKLPRALPLPLLLLALLIAVQLPQQTIGAATVCLARTAYTPDEVVNIAVPVWLEKVPHGLYRGRLGDSPLASGVNQGSLYHQPAYLAMDLHQEMMQARDFKLPLPSGINVTLNVVSVHCLHGA
jgi:hypothetical protein